MTNQTNKKHFAIVQRSSDAVQVVAESAAEAGAEYKYCYRSVKLAFHFEEATEETLTASWHSAHDVVLVPCP